MSTPEPEGLVERLRSREIYDANIDGAVDPKAVYRTRPVALFEEAASAIQSIQAQLAKLTAERDELATMRERQNEQLIEAARNLDSKRVQFVEARRALRTIRVIAASLPDDGGIDVIAAQALRSQESEA